MPAVGEDSADQFAERADEIPLGDLGDAFVGRDLVDRFAGMRPVRRRQIQPGLFGEAIPARSVLTARIPERRRSPARTIRPARPMARWEEARWAAA